MYICMYVYVYVCRWMRKRHVCYLGGKGNEQHNPKPEHQLKGVAVLALEARHERHGARSLVEAGLQHPLPQLGAECKYVWLCNPLQMLERC